MAKRFRFKRKASRSGFMKAKVRRGKSKSSTYGLMGKVGGAMIYGAGREYVATAIQPVTGMLEPFLGEASDEVTLLAAATFGHGLISKIPMGSNIADAMIYIEGARLGEIVRKKVMGQTSSSNVSNAPLLG